MLFRILARNVVLACEWASDHMRNIRKRQLIDRRVRHSTLPHSSWSENVGFGNKGAIRQLGPNIAFALPRSDCGDVVLTTGIENIEKA